MSIREIGGVLGVGKSTVGRDAVPDGTPAEPEPPEPVIDLVPNGTPEPEPPTFDELADEPVGAIWARNAPEGSLD
jgi:hypothetical protein